MLYPHKELLRGDNSVQVFLFQVSLHLPVPKYPTDHVLLYLPLHEVLTCFFSIPTVIQGVDIALLGLNNQSFARLMEQRLAPLFMMSHQQGRRFRRATTVGSYTVQVLKGPVLRALLACVLLQFL